MSVIINTINLLDKEAISSRDIELNNKHVHQRLKTYPNEHVHQILKTHC